MKQLLRSLAFFFIAGLTFASGFAVAQTIVRSVQQSQDPSGPIGFDVNNNVFFQRGVHILSTAPATPVLSACGTTPTIVGTDFSAIVTTGTGAVTSCTITFSTAFGTAPRCVVSMGTTNAGPVFATATTTALTINYASAASQILDYVCTSNT